MKPVKLFGFAGRAGSGKDTAADMMTDMLFCDTSESIISLRFAAPIKIACRRIFGWTAEHTDGALKDLVDPRFGVSPRHAMQTLGTEWGRDMISPNLWRDSTLNDFDKSSSIGIVRDVRFPNEAEEIQDRGGVVIWIDRDGHALATPDHASEPKFADLNPDHMLRNRSTLTNLRDSVRRILNLNGYEI